MLRIFNFLLLCLVIVLIIYGGLIIKQKSEQLNSGTKIYFFYHGNLHPVLRNFEEIPPAELLSKVLTDLWAGPRAEEIKQGVISLIPKDVKITSYSLENGLLTVNLNKLFLNLSGNALIEGILKQIVFTATQFANIKAVEFKIEGQPGKTLIIGGEGYTINGPLNREFFKQD